MAGRKTPLESPEKSTSLDGPAAVLDTCQEDYAPCTCNSQSIGTNPPYLVVDCTAAPSFASVQAVFRRTSAMNIKYFYFAIPPSEVNNTVPADLLRGKSAQWISITCPSTATKLKIDPTAFNSSQDYVGLIKITLCDLSQLDHQFVANLHVLTELQYLSSTNVDSQWQSLPALPSLVTLLIEYSPDFESFQNLPLSNIPALRQLSINFCPKFQFLPVLPLLTTLTINSCPLFESLPLTPLLTTLRIISCPLFSQWDVVAQLTKLATLSLVGFDNETINTVLDSIVSLPMVSLTISSNGLTQVPPQIQQFSQLEILDLKNNKISAARNGSIAFAKMPRTLDLTYNELTTIEPAAFQGLCCI